MPCKSVLYAGDTFFISSNNDIKILEANQNKAMDKALQWLKANSVVVNDSKTKPLLFSLTLY